MSGARYTVPAYAIYLTSDEERALQLARREFAANPSYDAFEVREGERLLFTEVRAGGPPEPTPEGLARPPRMGTRIRRWVSTSTA
jgi:hypothetical protein